MSRVSVEGAWGLVLAVVGIGIGLVGQFSSEIGISTAFKPVFGWLGIVLIAVGILLGVMWLIRREPADLRAAKRTELGTEIDSLNVEAAKLDAAIGQQRYFLTVAQQYGDTLRSATVASVISNLELQRERVERNARELTAARDRIKVRRDKRTSPI